MRGELDELWHTSILYTGKYSMFCNAIVGVFLHHDPGDRTVPPTEDEVAVAITTACTPRIERPGAGSVYAEKEQAADNGEVLEQLRLCEWV